MSFCVIDLRSSFIAFNHLLELSPLIVSENELDHYQYLIHFRNLVDKPQNHSK